MTEAEKHRLVNENMGLVAIIAADYRGRGVDFDDLFQCGCEGLTKASESFDPKKGKKFSIWAGVCIRSEMMHATRSEMDEWPAESEAGSDEWLDTGNSSRFDDDTTGRVYEHDIWGDAGNARAIYESWSALDASPEDLSILYSDIQDKRAKFEAAFLSLTQSERKLVTWVYLETPAKPITQAARDLGKSYFQAIRMLKKALKTMREVIVRMENNSGGNTANGHPSIAGLHGCAPGTVAA